VNVAVTHIDHVWLRYGGELSRGNRDPATRTRERNFVFPVATLISPHSRIFQTLEFIPLLPPIRVLLSRRDTRRTIQNSYQINDGDILLDRTNSLHFFCFDI